MPHAIEHSEHCIGPQNAHVLNKLSNAYQTALSLASWGCIIESITSRVGQPVIWLKPIGACWQLENGVYLYGIDDMGRYKIHQAEVDGTVIKWKTRRS